MKNVRLEIFLIVCTALLLFLIMPWIFITSSPGEFIGFNVTYLVLSGLVYSFLLTFIGLVIFLPFVALGKTTLMNQVIRFLFFWAVLSGFLLPLASATGGMVDPQIIPSNRWHFALVMFFSILFVFLTQTKWKSLVLKFVFLFLILNLATLLYGAFGFISQERLRGNNRAKLSQLSREKNIIVLSFDGVPGDTLAPAFQANPEFREKFKDFIFFPNAIATSPGTTASTAGSLLGNINMKQLGETEKDIYKNGNFQDSLINSDSYDVTSFGAYNGFNLKKERRTPPIYRNKLLELDASLTLYKYALVRIGSKYLVRVYDWILKGYLQKPLNEFKQKYMTSSLPDLHRKMEQHEGAQWDKQFMISILDYYTMLDGLNATANGKRALFMHFLFTHPPVDYDEKCGYRSYDKKWFDANQNEKGLENQTGCVLLLLSRYVDELKRLGVYDQSLLVFKSDHGAPVSYFSKPPENYKINYHDLWGFNRYRAMLMIKDIGVQKEELTVREELVTLNDLAKTLCLKSEGKSCEKFKGLDLFSDQLTSNDSIYLYVVRKPGSNYKFDSHRAVRIQRKKDLLETMRSHLGIVLTE